MSTSWDFGTKNSTSFSNQTKNTSTFDFYSLVSSYLLMEDGTSYLLQEDGSSKFLLENSHISQTWSFQTEN